MISDNSEYTEKDKKTISSLAEIQKPIRAELNAFKVHFKKHLRTDVFLLNRLIDYLLRMKGKEMRPLLVLLSARISGEISERTYTAATMIELLHTATLIHDDVVDEAEKRRGFFSINYIWKNKASVLLGDYLLARGLLVAVREKETELLESLSTAVQKMSEGELRQLKASKLQNITEDKYFQIISEKTGSLLVACCECGAISTGASPEIRERLKLIGYHIGLAFQIKDDLLDYSSNNTGKSSANDIIERKITLPFLAAMDSSDRRAKRTMKRLYRKKNKTDEDISEIKSFVYHSGGIAYAKNKMEYYAGCALKLLYEFPDSETRHIFSEFIRFVIYRKK
ncbi:polyprenyl synthetase family protein [Balneolaceae bacterium ANBcel3]|nr:polyprenyl synthetase family protein [Balneolaceae bacterium ANBcel3]